MENPRISIVIPVYNGQEYLAETLDSALKQTFARFEVICVNDCSTDNSLSILNAYEQKDPRIRVFTTEENQGIVPKVLNYAIPHIRGEYFVYSSQDDFFSEDWLEKMLDRAIETNADATIPDLVFFRSEQSQHRTTVGVHGDHDVLLSNRDAVSLSLDWTIPQNALWKAELIKKIGYEEYGMNADEYSARVFFLNCNKIAFSEGTFYYRVDNPLAITRKLSYKTFDLPYTHFKLYQLLKKNDFDSKLVDRELMRAVWRTVEMKEVLIVERMKRLVNKSRLSHGDAKKAEKRLRKWYCCFDDKDVFDVVRRQKGVTHFITRLGIVGGYSLFNIVCGCRALAHCICGGLAR